MAASSVDSLETVVKKIKVNRSETSSDSNLPLNDAQKLSLPNEAGSSRNTDRITPVSLESGDANIQKEKSAYDGITISDIVESIKETNEPIAEDLDGRSTNFEKNVQSPDKQNGLESDLKSKLNTDIASITAEVKLSEDLRELKSDDTDVAEPVAKKFKANDSKDPQTINSSSPPKNNEKLSVSKSDIAEKNDDYSVPITSKERSSCPATPKCDLLSEDKEAPHILQGVEYDGTFPNITERYFTPYYCIDVREPRDDICIRVHSNRICMITLAPSHPILNDKKKIKKVNFKVSEKLDRASNKVSGKGKHGAQPLQPDANICSIECEDGKIYLIKCCMTGKLVEVNDMLLDKPELLLEEPHKGGYLAIALPNLKLVEEMKSKLLSQELYDMMVMAREVRQNEGKLETPDIDTTSRTVTTMEQNFNSSNDKSSNFSLETNQPTNFRNEPQSSLATESMTHKHTRKKRKRTNPETADAGQHSSPENEAKTIKLSDKQNYSKNIQQASNTTNVVSQSSSTTVQQIPNSVSKESLPVLSNADLTTIAQLPASTENKPGVKLSRNALRRLRRKHEEMKVIPSSVTQQNTNAVPTKLLPTPLQSAPSVANSRSNVQPNVPTQNTDQKIQKKLNNKRKRNLAGRLERKQRKRKASNAIKLTHDAAVAAMNLAGQPTGVKQPSVDQGNITESGQQLNSTKSIPSIDPVANLNNVQQHGNPAQSAGMVPVNPKPRKPKRGGIKLAKAEPKKNIGATLTQPVTNVNLDRLQSTLSQNKAAVPVNPKLGRSKRGGKKHKGETEKDIADKLLTLSGTVHRTAVHTRQRSKQVARQFNVKKQPVNNKNAVVDAASNAISNLVQGFIPQSCLIPIASQIKVDRAIEKVKEAMEHLQEVQQSIQTGKHNVTKVPVQGLTGIANISNVGNEIQGAIQRNTGPSPSCSQASVNNGPRETGRTRKRKWHHTNAMKNGKKKRQNN